MTNIATKPKTINLQLVPPLLEEAQDIVSGPVEMILLPRGEQMLVNEDGLITGLLVNHEASRLAERVIVGNAIVLSGGAVWT